MFVGGLATLLYLNINSTGPPKHTQTQTLIDQAVKADRRSRGTECSSCVDASVALRKAQTIQIESLTAENERLEYEVFDLVSDLDALASRAIQESESLRVQVERLENEKAALLQERK